MCKKKKDNLLKKIIVFVKSNIVPLLKKHKGNIKIIGINENNFLLVKLTGRCSFCILSKYTLKNLIEKKIVNVFKKIKGLLLVN